MHIFEGEVIDFRKYKIQRLFRKVTFDSSKQFKNKILDKWDLQQDFLRQVLSAKAILNTSFLISTQISISVRTDTQI